jgi:hypothetical protein
MCVCVCALAGARKNFGAVYGRAAAQNPLQDFFQRKHKNKTKQPTPSTATPLTMEQQQQQHTPELALSEDDRHKIAEIEAGRDTLIRINSDVIALYDQQSRRLQEIMALAGACMAHEDAPKEETAAHLKTSIAHAEAFEKCKEEMRRMADDAAAVVETCTRLLDTVTTCPQRRLQALRNSLADQVSIIQRVRTTAQPKV